MAGFEGRLSNTIALCQRDRRGESAPPPPLLTVSRRCRKVGEFGTSLALYLPATNSFIMRGEETLSRQDAKNAKFGLVFFLCGLCAFARDIPAFDCGSAALGLW
jgi:hypothetical protein